MGSFVKDFEADLSAYLGRPATCVATGTAAVQLGVQGVGCGPGDDVLVPSLTFVATFQAIRATGARAIPCEVVPGTLTLDVDEFLRRFLLHVLPKRFVRIRYFGFFASRTRTRGLARCRQVLAVASPPPDTPRVTPPRRASRPCPRCGAPMPHRTTDCPTTFLDALLAEIVHDTS